MGNERGIIIHKDILADFWARLRIAIVLALNGKADVSSVYTKEEGDTRYLGLAPIGGTCHYGYGSTEIDAGNAGANVRGSTDVSPVEVNVGTNAKSVFVIVPTGKHVRLVRNMDTMRRLSSELRRYCTTIWPAHWRRWFTKQTSKATTLNL